MVPGNPHLSFPHTKALGHPVPLHPMPAALLCPSARRRQGRQAWWAGPAGSSHSAEARLCLPQNSPQSGSKEPLPPKNPGQSLHQPQSARSALALSTRCGRDRRSILGRRTECRAPLLRSVSLQGRDKVQCSQRSTPEDAGEAASVRACTHWFLSSFPKHSATAASGISFVLGITNKSSGLVKEEEGVPKLHAHLVILYKGLEETPRDQHHRKFIY